MCLEYVSGWKTQVFSKKSTVVEAPYCKKKKDGDVLSPSPNEYRTRHASIGRLEVLQILHT
jgi:hypothetical protein